MRKKINMVVTIAVSVMICILLIVFTSGNCFSLIRSENDICDNITLQREVNDENITLTDIDVSTLDGKKTYIYTFEKDLIANSPSLKVIHECDEKIKDVNEGDIFSSRTVYYRVTYSGVAKKYREDLFGLVSRYICYTEIPYLNIFDGDKNEDWVKEDINKEIQGLVDYHINYEDCRMFFRRIL